MFMNTLCILNAESVWKRFLPTARWVFSHGKRFAVGLWQRPSRCLLDSQQGSRQKNPIGKKFPPAIFMTLLALLKPAAAPVGSVLDGGAEGFVHSSQPGDLHSSHWGLWTWTTMVGSLTSLCRDEGPECAFPAQKCVVQPSCCFCCRQKHVSIQKLRSWFLEIPARYLLDIIMEELLWHPHLAWWCISVSFFERKNRLEHRVHREMPWRGLQNTSKHAQLLGDAKWKSLRGRKPGGFERPDFIAFAWDCFEGIWNNKHHMSSRVKCWKPRLT